MKLTDNEAVQYVGGGNVITAALISATTKVITMLYQFGQNLGSTIRRLISKTSC